MTPERRRQPETETGSISFGLLLTLTTLASILVSVGIAWGTATAQLKNKVEVLDQQRVDTSQDAQIKALSDQLAGLKPQLDRIEQRVSDIYCSSVPPAQKAGCQ